MRRELSSNECDTGGVAVDQLGRVVVVGLVCVWRAGGAVVSAHPTTCTPEASVTSAGSDAAA